ncbi:MAG: hypothetical protein KKE50_04785 [Nanoarchaeota archaeon]|nr:hypothetical protein [Nanoarchaeota archaeon]
MKSKVLLGILSFGILFLVLVSSIEGVTAVSFSKGDLVKVINAGSIGLAVRGPTACSPSLQKARYDGYTGYVMDGPDSSCGDGYTRWKIHWDIDSVEGWTIDTYGGN